ncbi:YceI family protein [Marixanthomonas ophiurae]|uniref:YceI family protein n=1 Tax=Marixanthomonas ophiurae TaxID=387659 RepID=A0A3E1QDL2_9FLAO|nr:YceI family protein [Marixanthomonas ophiurae]RFN60249.1 YceI family protein [Marixanthomonas ophiurae]
MDTLKNIKKILRYLLILVVITPVSVAQTYQLNNASSTLKVDGTSNIHDWEIIAENQQGKLLAEFENEQLVKIKQLDFTVKAESLKSGKSRMDKNTYKALNTDKYKQISYTLTNVNNINCTTLGNCKATTMGELTIVGTTKPIIIIFDVRVVDDKIILSGNKSIRMTEYNVDPPTALLGTITTGDELNIIFQSVFLK